MKHNQQQICYELKIKVPESAKNLLAEILQELEISDFVYGQIDCDLEAEYDPSKVNEDLYDKMEVNPPLILYSEDRDYLESVQDALQLLFPKVNLPLEKDTFVLSEIADQNWRESWKKSFKPVLVQEIFAILPPWEEVKNFTQKYKIVIDPGMAFGTGQHETTRLCLELLTHYPVPERFLDVGTGSGILAIAAQLLGAKCVIGNDIDPLCMAIAQNNAKKNGLNHIQFLNQSLWQIAEKNFDMVVANIQSRPLKTLVPAILKKVKENGFVILSGILTLEKEDFISFLNENQAVILNTLNLNDWCAIVCQNKT